MAANMMARHMAAADGLHAVQDIPPRSIIGHYRRAGVYFVLVATT